MIGGFTPINQVQAIGLGFFDIKGVKMSDEQKLKDYHALMQAQQEHFFISGFVFFVLTILNMSIFPNYEFGGFVITMIVCGYLNHRFITTHKCPFCGDNFFLLNRNKDFSEVKTIRKIPLQKICKNCGEPTKKDKVS